VSTLQTANIHLDSSGNNQLEFSNSRLKFKLGSNTDLLPTSVITSYLAVLPAGVAGYALPSNSYIVSLSQTAPSGYTEITGTGYTAPLKVYKKN
jgi:hypothetical protein